METQLQDETAAYVRGLSPLSGLLSAIACLLLFLMMMVTFCDVVGRYVFSSPLPAAYEIVSLIMPCVIFCALPLTVLREGHVTVDLLDGFMPRALIPVRDLLINLFCAGALALITWRVAVRSMDQKTYMEASDQLYLPLWPFSAMMCVLCAIATVAFLAKAWIAIAPRKVQQ